MTESPGILGVESIECFVHDLPRSIDFYTSKLGFSQRSSEASPTARSAVLRGGGCVVRCTMPTSAKGRAARFLEHHPDGIGTVVFRVRDVARTFRVLEQRGATPVADIVAQGGERSFAITTPFGGCHFRYVERPSARDEACDERSPFLGFDHLTANFETLAPPALWLEHVLGFEDFWKVEFGTEDAHRGTMGTGLRSRVLVDRESGLKFALNEPRRPNFDASQIEVFIEDNHGPGIQHVALAVRDLVTTVETLRARGVGFLETTGAYYDALPARLASADVHAIAEPIDAIRRLGILVDGSSDGRYLLQIFMRDAASLYDEPEAGPFFFELIERKGDVGFGEGNFRALFESIERDQARHEGGE